MAGVQTAMAQPGMVVWKNGQPVGYRISDVDRVEFVDNVNEYLEFEYVDLGLPSGTLWATMNVGANSPEDYGDYFAWGETETKASFYWDTYKWMNEGQSNWSQINKYTFEDNQMEGCWYSGGEFVGDDKKKLLGADDAATANWGSKWQMPTREQFEELINTAYTTSEFTTLNGVSGLKVTGKNGNSIFLPAAGSRIISDSYYAGTGGYYWSHSIDPSSSHYASLLFFNSSNNIIDTNNRSLGLCVRPVRKSHEYVDLGLPSGTLWATCNIGADEPEEYGDYFAWGEIYPKEEFTFENYLYKDALETIMEQHISESGVKDLLPQYDAATANWGDDWQMPTYDDCYELWANSTTELTTLNGVICCKITGQNGNSIFLPIAGYFCNDGFLGEGEIGVYWMKSFYPNEENPFPLQMCVGGEINFYISDASEGASVRPVRKK